jgi:uncharacterized membrane protein
MMWVFPMHLVAIIVWLGVLFVLTALRPTNEPLPANASVVMKVAVLSRYLPLGGVSLLTIIATGIVLVHVHFGGFDHIPVLHRWNMLIGIPAIALYAYTQLVAFRACRRAVRRSDWVSAGHCIRRISTLAGIVLILGLVSSAVSAAARYAP